MINIGITGGESLIAGELIRLLINHTDSNVKWVASNNATGLVASHHKGLSGECDLTFSAPLLDEVDVVFCCDKASSQWIMQASTSYETLRIVDLSNSITNKNIIYGLCEINRKFMVHDCYDTVQLPSPGAMVVLLALVPLAKNLMLKGDIHVTLDCGELCGNIMQMRESSCADEILEVLKAMQHSFDSDIHINVVNNQPTRGITATVTIASNMDLNTIKQLFLDYYDDHNFTFLCEQEIDSSHVINTNKCLLNIVDKGDTLQITSVADALLKGAAGNAVHAMNLLFGLHERTGLALKAQVF